MNAYTRICAGSLCLMLLLIFAEVAQAHRVNIFAWLEGETVRVECSFRRDSPVQQGKIIVFDAQTDTELLQGRTDKKVAHGCRRILQSAACRDSSHIFGGRRGWISSGEAGFGCRERICRFSCSDGSPESQGRGGDRRCGIGPASGTLASCPCRWQ